MKLVQKLMAAAVFMGMGPVAQASLIKYDNVVLDTDTGLTWLQLSETAGLSINQILNGAGGFTRRDPFAADSAYYRYATEREIATLLDHYGLYATDYTRENAGAGRFIFGIGGSTPQGTAGTWFNDVNQGAIGMSFNAYVSAELTNGDAAFALSPNCPIFNGCQLVSIDYNPRFDQLNFSSPRVGSFLVAIPEPETVALLGMGLLAFAVSRGKSQK